MTNFIVIFILLYVIDLVLYLCTPYDGYRSSVNHNAKFLPVSGWVLFFLWKHDKKRGIKRDKYGCKINIQKNN